MLATIIKNSIFIYINYFNYHESYIIIIIKYQEFYILYLFLNLMFTLLLM